MAKSHMERNRERIARVREELLAQRKRAKQRYAVQMQRKRRREKKKEQKAAVQASIRASRVEQLYDPALLLLAREEAERLVRAPQVSPCAVCRTSITLYGSGNVVCRCYFSRPNQGHKKRNGVIVACSKCPELVYISATVYKLKMEGRANPVCVLCRASDFLTVSFHGQWRSVGASA